MPKNTTRLHDPQRNFRDSCGFAQLAHMDGEKSHWLVRTTLESLSRLTHRGAVAADGKSGDGCGIMLQFPEPFLRDVSLSKNSTSCPMPIRCITWSRCPA